MTQIVNKVITCLDGKERVFNSYGENSISYNTYKDGKATGRTFFIKEGKYPKFVTEQMIFETTLESTNETDKEANERLSEAHTEDTKQTETNVTTFDTEAPETAPEASGRAIGYMRISTTKEEQKFDRQEEQLKALGCNIIYADRLSGAKRDRPELNRMLEELQVGDTVHIVAIDRLSRSTKNLLEIVDIIKNKGASLKSINDAWLDTTSENPMSEFLLTVMGALAQMERQMITQRVKEGVKVARAKGVKFGRPTANKNKVDYAIELYEAGEHPVRKICDITGISKATLYRKIKEAGLK